MANNISLDFAQQIVDTIKEVCGHHINFIDRNDYILASTGLVSHSIENLPKTERY